MITIVNKYNGEVICKYSNACKSLATKDSFIANVKGGWQFRTRFHAIVELFDALTFGVQCTLRDQYAILECLTEEEKRYW